MIFTNFVSPLKAMSFFQKKDVRHSKNHTIDIFCYFLIISRSRVRNSGALERFVF
jgi:hypothetical protein